MKKGKKTEEAATEKTAEKERKRAAGEAIKRDREEIYAMRKTGGLKILRVLLWGMIAFVFIKGVMVSVRPDPAEEVYRAVADFRAELAAYQNKDSQVMAFAEGFAVEYLTYSATENINQYTERIARYIDPAVLTDIQRFPSGSSATVLYAQAYRQAAYSETQADVWVSLLVEYTRRETSTDGVVSEQVTTERTILKVPVAVSGDAYIVEDLPAYVNDTMKISGYAAPTFVPAGDETPKEINEAIKVALTNFYRAYYSDEQSVINYYLDAGADPKNFMGLDGRVEFQGVTKLRTFYATETDKTHFWVTTTVAVKDRSGMVVDQNYHLIITYKDNQYYVSSMDVRGLK